jgi:hypothetical protein
LGSAMVSLAVFQNDLSSLGISESSMSASRIRRKRLKSVSPLVRDLEVVHVILLSLRCALLAEIIRRGWPR